MKLDAPRFHKILGRASFSPGWTDCQDPLVPVTGGRFHTSTLAQLHTLWLSRIVFFKCANPVPPVLKDAQPRSRPEIERNCGLRRARFSGMMWKQNVAGLPPPFNAEAQGGAGAENRAATPRRKSHDIQSPPVCRNTVR